MPESKLDMQHRLALIDHLRECEHERARIQNEITSVQAQLRALTVKEGRNSNDVFARLFKKHARKILSDDQYNAIVKAAQQQLGYAERRINGADEDEAHAG